MGKKCCPFSKVAYVLALVGALNWGLVGALNFDLVSYIATMTNLPILAKIIYIIVGLSAVFLLAKMATKCAGGSCSK